MRGAWLYTTCFAHEQVEFTTNCEIRYSLNQDDEGGRGLKVRALLKLLRKVGWEIDRTRGDHRQLVHPIKPGLVTNGTVAPKTLWARWLRQPGTRGCEYTDP